MLTIKEVFDYLQAFAPLALACEGDNPGVLVNGGAPVAGILCALDITDAVVDEAVAQGCNLIVSHHPVIYRPLRALGHTDIVYRLAREGISAICMHTNLDTAEGGVNDTLAALLGLQNVQSFGSGMGRIGVLTKPVSAEDFVQQCSTLFGCCQYTKGGAPVGTVAVLGGSGGSEMADAFAAGADAYVTGEAGHHCGVDAVHAGKTLVVAGHYDTEHPVVKVLQTRLTERFSDVTVRVSEREEPPFSWRC